MFSHPQLVQLRCARLHRTRLNLFFLLIQWLVDCDVQVQGIRLVGEGIGWLLGLGGRGDLHHFLEWHVLLQVERSVVRFVSPGFHTWIELEMDAGEGHVRVDGGNR